MALPFACRYFITILVAALQPMSCAFHFKVYILRHGQTDANAGGIIQGSADFSRLTELGKQQAEDAYRAFDVDIRISSIYSSPLSRARETLEELRQTDLQQPEHRLPPTDLILDNLREIDFFDWEGKDKAELQAAFPESWQAWEVGNPSELVVFDTANENSNGQPNIRYPLLELWERADRVWDEIIWQEKQHAEEKRAALVVAHGSLGQALLGTAMGWQADQFRKHEFPNCGIVELNFSDYKLRQIPADRWRWIWPMQSAKWNHPT
jgi:probable phosphoglycerate mutase